jgi:IS30 family transposase
MTYHQITLEERYTLALLRRQVPRMSLAAIARVMGRHRSTIVRELRRNTTRADGGYRSDSAQEHTNARRSRSRRNQHFGPGEWAMVEGLLMEDYSPEQICGRLRHFRALSISHETIYKHVWENKRNGGYLYLFLRQRSKQRRKRYGTHEKRGTLQGKRHISERPAAVEHRRELGHWEGDTIVGTGSQHCVLSLVERVTGCVLLEKLQERTPEAVNRAMIPLIRRHPTLFKTISLDNGTEFHGYREVETATGVPFYFATPYHSWERGSNENANGLIRQYIPKGVDMRDIDQLDCNAITRRLNDRPRKRHGFLTPLERLRQFRSHDTVIRPRRRR